MTFREGVQTIYSHDLAFLLWSLVVILPFFFPALAEMAGVGQFMLLSLFAFAHGTRCYGLRAMAGFTIIVLLVANVMENLSINTGFPFGWFAHQPALGPKLFDVPILVNFGYLAIGYVSISVADTILGRLPAGRTHLAVVSIAVVAGFIAAGWNASLDPIGSTLQKSWLWRDGGGYFGVPITNSFGWMVTMTFTAMLAVPMLKGATNDPPRASTAIWLSQPPAVLIIQTILLIVGWLRCPRGFVADPTGQDWPIAALMETTALISTLTCGAFGTVGLLRAWQSCSNVGNFDRSARGAQPKRGNQ